MAKLGFRYRAGDLRRWDNMDDVNLIPFHSWTTSIHYIQSFNETDHRPFYSAKPVRDSAARPPPTAVAPPDTACAYKFFDGLVR